MSTKREEINFNHFPNFQFENHANIFANYFTLFRN